MTPELTESPTSDRPTAAGAQQDPVAQAQEKAKEGAEAAREQAQNVAAQARDQARTQVDQRSTEAGDRLKGASGDARSMAEHLRRDGKDGPAKLVEEAADRAESAGRYLSEADADKLLRDVEQYARKNPWAVIAGGLAVGFAASRLLSASSATRLGGTPDTPAPRQLAAPSGASTVTPPTTPATTTPPISSVPPVQPVDPGPLGSNGAGGGTP